VFLIDHRFAAHLSSILKLLLLLRFWTVVLTLTGDDKATAADTDKPNNITRLDIIKKVLDRTGCASCVVCVYCATSQHHFASKEILKLRR